MKFSDVFTAWLALGMAEALGMIAVVLIAA